MQQRSQRAKVRRRPVINKPTTWVAAAALLVGALIVGRSVLSNTTASAEQTPSGTAETGQQIAIASYVTPTDAGWTRLLKTSSSKTTVLIANVLNGPGAERVPAWSDVINRAHTAGKRVLGYVDTGYFGRTETNKRPTRLGSTDPADWIVQVEQDVDAWYAMYGDAIGGIFFDDGHNSCGTNDEIASWYAHINEYTKRAHPGAMTIANPGTAVPKCYEDVADVLLTFEGSYSAYRGAATPEENYKPLDWTPKSPDKLWHIVYKVGKDQIKEVATTAQSRGAGYLETTDDDLPNPYDQMPSDEYLTELQNSVAGGKPTVSTPAPFPEKPEAVAAPTELKATASDSTSVSISWTAASGAARYLLRLDGMVVATVPGSMTHATIGGLAPDGKSHAVEVVAQGKNGGDSAPSNSITVTTEAPGDKPITNIKMSETADTITFSADFQLPFAFHRVYVVAWDNKQQSPLPSTPCWPIMYNTTDHVCAEHLIENSSWLTYTGNFKAKSTESAQWSWSTQSITPVVNGHTWAWTVPKGNPAIRPDSFVVQGEGDGPLTTVFVPCPIGGIANTTGKYCTSR